MKAKRIMFFVHIETEEDLRKWNELLDENNWINIKKELITYPSTIVIPNMTFDCAEKIDEQLMAKGLERTWLKDNEPDYYVELAELGWE